MAWVFQAGTAEAQTPELLNYQGRLLNGTNLVNGNVGLSLRLFNTASGGTAQYEDSNTVTVVDGLYSTFLGDNTTRGSLVVALTNVPVWVEVAVNGTALAPREQLAAVGYALATRGLSVDTNDNVTFRPETNSVSSGSHDAFCGGGAGNSIGSNSDYSVLAGGVLNALQGGTFDSFLGAGSQNSIQANAHNSVLCGGQESSIGPGSYNCFLGSGAYNHIQTNATASFIGGGVMNSILSAGSYSFVGCGFSNTIGAGAQYAVAPGGFANTAGGSYSFAAGYYARATNTGAFVWSDNSSTSPTVSTNNNSVTFRAFGGFRIFTAAGVGANLSPGSGSWTTLSDRNAKENFRPVDGQALLNKIAKLEVCEWNYKTQDASIRHLGPTAQDFRAAFGLGETPTGISTVDADGVALAAIQALNRKLEAQLDAKDAQLAELRQQLQALQAQVNGRPSEGASPRALAK